MRSSEPAIEERYRRISETGIPCPKSQYKAASERFALVKDVLEENRDVKGMGLLEELVSAAQSYIQNVVRMEISPIQKMRLEREDLQAIVQQRDQRRKISHDALISQLTIVNRYLFRNYEAGDDIPYGGVYSLPPETLNPLDRIAVGDWAGYLVLGLYEKRTKS